MNTAKVLDELSALYPAKPVKQLPPSNPTEIICEFDGADNHPQWSLAMAVIDRSKPHYHRRISETYHVIKGQLTLHVDNEELTMYEGQHYTIAPGRVHWAEGEETWVEVYCSPAYDQSDHHLV